MIMKRVGVIIWILLLCVGNLLAVECWQTHFAYNSVQVIAMDKDEVYALANGKLFSINQQNEHLTLFTNFSGLHGTEIVYIAYDDLREQLLIFYADGKIDIRRNKNMHYVSDLYNKQMTCSKRCNNVTIRDNLAYLAMDFGILTFDLEAYEFVDTYYIAPEAQDVRVTDVMFVGDSIYAQTHSAIYTAHIEDNVVDFRNWNTCQKLPQPFDIKKGKEYVDVDGGIWKVAGEKGVSRDFVTGEHIYYLPEGPCVNNPYNIEVANGKLYMVPGGRWASQDKRPGNVMIYENGQWTNITNSYIEQQTNKSALDFMDVAVDPQDPSHFFVTSYGTGLYEFQDSLLVGHYTTNNSILSSAAPNIPERYTRLESAAYDDDNCLWALVNGEVDTTLVCFLPNGGQRGVNLYLDPATRFFIHTSSNMVIDAVHPEKKWMVSCRNIPAVVQLDDGGTPFDAQDDKCKVQSEFHDQNGNVIIPEYFYGLDQAPNGDIWVGSSSGPIIIPTSVDFLQSNQCLRLSIPLSDGSNLLDVERVNTFAWDKEMNIWIGTQTGGVYVLTEDASELLAHYTIENSVMPSNSVLSLAYDSLRNKMFIATGMGLVSYTQDSNINVGVDVYNEDEESFGSMYQWRSHAAFSKIDEVVVMGNKAYGLSANSLFSVDKNDGEIEYYTKLNGLNGTVIDHIAYNESLDRMLITYRNGQIDIMTADETVYNISDLYLKQMSVSKTVNDICMYKNKAILAMSFGILVVDLGKFEISDTYYIGNEGAELFVDYIAVANEMIYAATKERIYYASLTDNLMDYENWKILYYPENGVVSGMRAYADKLHMLIDHKLYALCEDGWQAKPITTNNPPLFRSLCTTKNALYALPYNRYGAWRVYEDTVSLHLTYGYNYAVQEDGDYYWLGSHANGLIHLQKSEGSKYQSDIQEYYPDGPLNNFAYRLRFFGDKLYMLPGGRWASQYKRPGDIMIYENNEWTSIKNADLEKAVGGHKLLDFMNVAQDPTDADHYFITTYGTGLLEMKGMSVVNLYLPSNSGLLSADPKNPEAYTRTDGAMYDDQGNLWLLNLGDESGKVHVVSPNGMWHSFDLYNNRDRIQLHTAGEIFIDNRNSHWKWIPVLRAGAGMILLQDNGTPTYHGDDNVIYRTSWIDQNSKIINPSEIRAVVQDQNGTIWIGTSSGIFAIPYYVDFTKSNQCVRVVIPRNDGSGLGDYMLDNEQINAIAVDGANRLWVGTANSGIFLLNPIGDIENIQNYTMETVAHFTTDNSILPTDEIISIAIQESTGEVFIGTGGGLVSYMSDASKPLDTFDELYAYPNPVLPTYQGYITVKGMMENSDVRIIDSSGNLVKTIQANGGSAAWDGMNANGQRVASGVYTVLCNTRSGKGHGSVKVLIMN